MSQILFHTSLSYLSWHTIIESSLRLEKFSWTLYICIFLFILSLTFCFDQNERLKSEVSDFKMHMEAQRDKLVSTKGGQLDYREKLARKNRDLAEAMEELQVQYLLLVFRNFCFQIFDAINVLNEIYCNFLWM